MSALFSGGMTQEERIAYVARMLDCSPSHPETWPRDSIERMLDMCERRADKDLRDYVDRMMRR